jgi:AcrR family transcriptional regulator
VDSDLLLSIVAPAFDRRVRKSRAALLRAAVELVSETGVSAVSVSDLAEAADVSRQVLYTQFGDRDALLLAAALDLVRRELVPGISAQDPRTPDGRARVLAATRHFAAYRVFYRAMFTSPRAYALSKALSSLLAPINRQLAEHLAGRCPTPVAIEDLTSFVTGGWSAILTAWVVDGEDPLDPEAMADRLLRLAADLTGV